MKPFCNLYIEFNVTRICLQITATTDYAVSNGVVRHFPVRNEPAYFVSWQILYGAAINPWCKKHCLSHSLGKIFMTNEHRHARRATVIFCDLKPLPGGSSTWWTLNSYDKGNSFTRLSKKSFVLFIQYPPDEGLFLLDCRQF